MIRLTGLLCVLGFLASDLTQGIHCILCLFEVITMSLRLLSYGAMDVRRRNHFANLVFLVLGNQYQNISVLSVHSE